MVQARTIEKLKAQSQDIAKEADADPETTRRIMEAIEERIKSNRRRPQEPAPEGCICLSEAERKYNIPNETISRWVKRGYLTVIKRTKQKVYISDIEISKIADIYKNNPGRGSWIIKKIIAGQCK